MQKETKNQERECVLMEKNAMSEYLSGEFEILGLFCDKRDKDEIFIKGKQTYLDEGHKNYVGAVVKGKATYARIVIKKRRKYED